MLLFDYLVHEGHWNSANQVAQDILLGRVQASEEVCFLVSASCTSHQHQRLMFGAAFLTACYMWQIGTGLLCAKLLVQVRTCCNRSH